MGSPTNSILPSPTNTPPSAKSLVPAPVARVRARFFTEEEQDKQDRRNVGRIWRIKFYILPILPAKLILLIRPLV